MNLRVGLLINPLAGLGGAVGLKGSDGGQIVAEALRRGAHGQAVERTVQAISALGAAGREIEWLTWGGEMGAVSCEQAGVPCRVLGESPVPSSSADTVIAARALLKEGVDLLLFAGGDGTARDICDVVGERVAVLGIPAGCKMHSSVYAINPESAGQLLAELVNGALVNVVEADVRDLDEQAFREGVVRACHYGTMRVPLSSRFVQQVKCGGREVEDLQVNEIAAWVVEQMQDDISYVMGSGSTVAEVMAQLGLENTLLGVDVVRNGKVVAVDIGATQLLDISRNGPTKAIITVIGGQGHLFGRGNQQFSPAVIDEIGRENLLVLASRIKLNTLQGRPLLVDTGEPRLDQSLCGLIPVICGYDDELLYRVATNASASD